MQNVVIRREFLRVAAAGLGLTALNASGLRSNQPGAATGVQRLSSARRILKEIVLKHAKAKDNAWLMLHGIRAMGKDFLLGDGSALDYLCSHYLKTKVVNGRTYLYIPIDDEGHPNAFLSEGALDAGAALDHRFRRNGRSYTLADLAAAAKALFAVDPASFNADEVAWSLIVFAYTTAPANDRWANAYGKTVRFADVVEFAMDTLEEATKQLQAAMGKGTLGIEDRIHHFACGGTHLIYGLCTCLRFGYKERGLTDRMRLQLDILVWRLESDSQLINRYYQEVAAENPEQDTRIYFLDAQLKFLGHAMEVINYARRFGLLNPSLPQENAIARAEDQLIDVVESLERQDVGKFAGDKKLFNLLVGDVCHAYHGITIRAG